MVEERDNMVDYIRRSFVVKENKRLKAESNIIQHGQWIHMEDYDSPLDSTWMCSCCKGKVITDLDDSPINHGFEHCPHCGAKMDGKE